MLAAKSFPDAFASFCSFLTLNSIFHINVLAVIYLSWTFPDPPNMGKGKFKSHACVFELSRSFAINVMD